MAKSPFAPGYHSVPIADIRPNPNALRDVDPESEDFIGIKNSIQQRGFVGTIAGRPATDPVTKEHVVEIIDGLQRFTACKLLGLATVPINVKEMSDDDVLVSQILMNVHRVETRPIEYTRQIIRILEKNPHLTRAQLATNLGKSPQWLDQRLSLVNIKDETVQKLIDESKITLANAFLLAKLAAVAPNELSDYVDRAMTLPNEEFLPLVSGRIQQIKTALKQGQKPTRHVFTPVPVLRSMKEINTEIESNLANTKQLLAMVKDTAAAFRLGLQWAVQLDPKTLEVKKAKFEAEVAEREAAKKKREEERAAEKARKDNEKIRSLSAV